MKQIYVIISAILACLPIKSFAEEPDECDLQMIAITAPTTNVVSPATSLPITLQMRNVGATAISGFQAKVSLDDKYLFTETISAQLPSAKFSTKTFTLENKLQVEYGKNYSLSIELLPLDGTTELTPANNSKTLEFSTPGTIAYPYVWSASTATEAWNTTIATYKFSDTNEAFEYSAARNGFTGNYIYSDIIEFPADKKSKVELDYKASGTALTLHVYVITSDAQTEIYNEAMELGKENYTHLNIPLTAEEPAIIKIHATSSSNGSVSFKNLSVKDDEPDMECSAILSPSISNITVGTPLIISARFSNPTGLDIESPKVCYTFGQTAVTEQINGTIKAGKSLDYTFTAPLTVSTPTSGTLTVQSLLDNDCDSDNNEQSMQLSFYSPASFPYYSNFDDLSQWTLVNADDDMAIWEQGALADQNGNNSVLHFTRFMNAPKDYAFTPAINIPAGKSRASFYIGGAVGSRVALLMGKSPEPEKMESVLAAEVKIDGWMTVADIFDVTEAGTYYFALSCRTSKGEIFVDELRIDRENDLGVNDITFDTQSGFNKTTSAVTISVSNFGIEPQSNIEVAYYLNDGTSSQLDKIATETITETINPGETVYHTFKTPADISASGKTYTLIGEICTKIGSDTRNDKVQSQSLTHYAAQELPYKNSFEDQARNAQWSMQTVEGSNGWTLANQFSNAYDSNYVLGHTSVGATADADDWAFSECIHIPAGTYEFAIFYRTYKTTLTGDTYNQSFSISLGFDAKPEAMTEKITSFENITVPGSVYKKFIAQITVETDGNYYLGFHSSSLVGKGVTYLDALSILPITEGLSGDYEADFANAASDWDIYHTKLNSWSLADGVMSMNRTAYYASMEGSAGWLVSPKLHYEADKDATVEFSYQLTGNAADNPELGLYAAPVNNPDEFELLQKFGASADYIVATHTIPASAVTGDRYFAIRPVMEKAAKAYTAKVNSFKVTYSAPSSLNEISADSAVSLSRNGSTLTVSTSSSPVLINVYDILGRTVASVNSTSDITTLEIGTGLMIVKVTTPAGTVVRKLTD